MNASYRRLSPPEAPEPTREGDDGDANPRGQRRPGVVRTAFLTLGIGLLAYLTVRLGIREILGMLARIQWSFVVVLLLYAAHQGARALALIACAPKSNSMSFGDALAIRLSGEAVQYLTFSGPILAEPTKAWLLRRHGLTTWEGLATTLAEYLASAIAAAVMAIAGLGYVLAIVKPSGAVRVATLVVFVFMLIFATAFIVGIAARVHIIGSIVRAFVRLPGLRHLRSRIGGLAEAEDLLIATLRDNPRRLLRIFTIEVAGQGFLGLELLVLLVALSSSMGVVQAMLVEGATKFITAGYFFVPGQVGVAEGTYAIIFEVFGLSASAGFTVSFVRRIRSIVAAGIGVAAMSPRRMRTRQAPGRPVDGREV